MLFNRNSLYQCKDITFLSCRNFFSFETELNFPLMVLLPVVIHKKGISSKWKFCSRYCNISPRSHYSSICNCVVKPILRGTASSRLLAKVNAIYGSSSQRGSATLIDECLLYPLVIILINFRILKVLIQLTPS
jgi:hypothetical protein